jgi:hypothetical protein
MIYYISMKFTYNILLAKNGTITGIIVSDNIIQQRFIQTNVIYQNNSQSYVRTTLSNDILSGSGNFQGVIVNGVIVNLTHNFAYKYRVNICYTYATWTPGQQTSSYGYKKILEAINNSKISRDGILVLNETIIL